MKFVNNDSINFKIKISNNIKVTLSETDELIILRLSALNLNKKEISECSNLSYKQIQLHKNRIKRLMKEDNWECAILKGFKMNILSYNDYTLSGVSNKALTHTARIQKKGDIDEILSIYTYREMLLLFVEDTKNHIIEGLKRKHKNSQIKKLSQSELTYLRLVFNGSGQPEILNELKISIHSAENYRRTIFKYLNVKNWFNAIRIALLLGLLGSPKIIKNNISNQINESAKKINALNNTYNQVCKSAKKSNLLNDISNTKKERNLSIYILLINLFNKIEFNIILNNYNMKSIL